MTTEVDVTVFFQVSHQTTDVHTQHKHKNIYYHRWTQSSSDSYCFTLVADLSPPDSDWDHSICSLFDASLSKNI